MAKSTRSKPTSRVQQPAPLEGNRLWRDRGRVRKSAPHLREPSVWEKLPGWAQHAVCIAFLVVVALGFWAPTLGGATIIGGDTVQWRGTAEAMLQYEAESGVDALWAPNVFGGMPGYLIHYPLKAPGVDAIPNLLRRLGLWPLAHFLVLLLGAYFLVFTLTRSKLAGALGAVGYGLTTYIPLILTAGHNSKFIALAWAPWLLLAFAAVLYRPDESGWVRNLFLAALFAIAAAVNLRAGHVQITYYVTFAAGVWWLAEGVAAVRLGRWKRFAVSTGVLALGAVLALAMVAQPYLAQWEYKAFTIRGAAGAGGEGLAWEYAMGWSQGAAELLTLLLADAFGGAELYWGPKPFTAGPHYIGPLVLLLAVFGVFGVARRATTGLGIAALLMTLFALGEHLPMVNRPMFELFPLFSAFRVPETWLAAVALVLAVLAGYGVYWVQRREATHEAEERKSRWLYVGFGATAALVALLWAAGPSMLDFARPGEVQQIEAAVAQQAGVGIDDPRVRQVAVQYLTEIRAERAEMLRGDALRALLFLGLAAALVVLYRRETIRPWLVAAGLVLLVTADLWGVGRRYFDEDHPALGPRRDVAPALPEYAFDRFLQNKVEMAGGPGSFRVLPLVTAPTSDARSSNFYESLAGYHGAKLALYQDYLDHLLFSPEGGLNDNALDLMSARYVVAPQPLPGLTPVFQDDDTGMLVLENPGALPRAFFVDSVAVVEREEAMYARLLAPDADLHHTAYLYEPPPAGYAPAPADSASTAVALQRYTPREIVWKVATDRPRLLVVSEVYYPAGWNATIDGTPADILRVDHLLRGVMVPAGEHLVAMRFDPETHRRGVIVSWIAALLVYLAAVALGGLLWYRRGHPKG